MERYIVTSGAIGCDIDEVIYPLLENFIDFNNKNYGTRVDFEIVNDYWSFDKIFGIDAPERLRRVHEFVRSKEALQIKPIEGAIEALDKLQKIYTKIALISGRQDEIIDVSLKYFDYHMPGRINRPLIHCHHFAGDDGVSKPEACIKNGVVYLIEDSIEYAIQCAEAGIFVLLFGNYPWNQKPIPGHLKAMIDRVSNWQEVLAYFNLS